MFRLFSLILFLFSGFCSFSQEDIIRVGLYRASIISEIQLELDGNAAMEMNSGSWIWGNKRLPKFKIIAKGNKLEVFQNTNYLGSVSKINCRSASGASVSLKPLKPDYKGNRYAGMLLITAEKGVLKMINIVDENDYLVGVLRGEVGYEKALSLYQVHAILSRTYARYYQWRHRTEGFEVCDQTHCQVYKGFFDYKPYHIAVRTTSGMVVRDSVTGNLAELLFHSNCGSQTNASEDVWKSTLPYCRSVHDTFCIQGKNAFWEKRLSLEKFCNKLNLTLPVDSTSRSEFCNQLCSFSIERPQEIKFQGRIYQLTDLRTRLEVKSAWFDWECIGDSVYLYGRGYGHGVGLCQEGAIRMASLGYTPEQIIQHYYTHVRISGMLKLPDEIRLPDFLN